MALKYSISLFTFVLSSTAQVPGTGVPAFADHNSGWPYYCSSDGAPPLCNSQCSTAINRLCSGDLSLGWVDTEQDCQIQYLPPPSAKKSDGTAGVTEDTCRLTFNDVLNTCGKDAGDPRTTFDPKYCTTSGGGGTYGWNDDGTTMTATGRYRIYTKGTDQCGQHQASWKQATSIIQWNDSWIGPDDQVVLDTNPPQAECPASGPQDNCIPAFPEPPPLNPECDTEVCDIYGTPYFANKTKLNWHEKSGYTRHNVVWSGFSNDTGGTELLSSLTDRCHTTPYNYQAWMDGLHHVAEFELPSSDSNDLCWCIADAIYDASAGITLDRNTWCEGSPIKASPVEFNSVG
ncbi:MAG: hypothetical protein Q9220_006071 [cf. Caloplaca sp. 1 TL-2023]